MHRVQHTAYFLAASAVSDEPFLAASAVSDVAPHRTAASQVWLLPCPAAQM